MSAAAVEDKLTVKHFCWSCGSKLHERAKFCSVCGENQRVQHASVESAEKESQQHIPPGNPLSVLVLPEQSEDYSIKTRPSRSIPLLLRRLGDEPECERLDYRPKFDRAIEAGEPHPWMRYWARLTDHMLVMLTAGVAISIFMGFAMVLGAFQDPVGKIAIAPTLHRLLMIPFIVSWIFLEAFLISRFATTLGKWIFGIRVLKSDGSKLTYRESISRAFGVWVFGTACGVPGITHTFQLWSLFALKKDKRSRWDTSCNSVSVYVPQGMLRKAVTFSLLVPVLLGLCSYMFYVNSPSYRMYD